MLNDLNFNDFISEPFVAAHMSTKYVPIDNFNGFHKKVSDVVLFGINNLNEYLSTHERIKLMYLSLENRQEIKSSGIQYSSLKTRSPFLLFTKEFFELSGAKFKTLRRRINNFKNRKIEIKDAPNSFQEFELFLKEWKNQRQHAHFQIYIGYDKNFYQKYLPIWKDRLIAKFFYLDGILEGYSIIEKVSPGCYNLLFHKANPNHEGFCLYMDFKMWEYIYNLEQDDFVVNMGSDSNEKGLLHYKTKSFPVEQRIFELYELTIKNLNVEGQV